MKIGVSLPSYYEEYLKKIANLNDLSVTTICGLILENFLSFNRNQNRFPLFRRNVRIVYDEKTSEIPVDLVSDNYSVGSLDQISKPLSREQLYDKLSSESYVDTEIHDDIQDPSFEDFLASKGVSDYKHLSQDQLKEWFEICAKAGIQ